MKEENSFRLRLDAFRIGRIGKVRGRLVGAVVIVVADAVCIGVVDATTAAAEAERNDQLAVNTRLLERGSSR